MSEYLRIAAVAKQLTELVKARSTLIDMDELTLDDDTIDGAVEALNYEIGRCKANLKGLVEGEEADGGC